MSQGSVIIVLNTSLPCISQHVSLIHVAVCGNGEEEEGEGERGRRRRMRVKQLVEDEEERRRRRRRRKSYTLTVKFMVGSEGAVCVLAW